MGLAGFSFLIGCAGVESPGEEVDLEEDLLDEVRFLGFRFDRGESSEEEVEEDVDVVDPIGRNAHSAMPLSFGARGQ